jgi:hypothetical protein
MEAHMFRPAVATLTFCLVATLLLPAPALAQDVCAQLQQSIQTLQANGGAGSQWEAMARQQLEDNGCNGDGSGSSSYVDRMTKEENSAPPGYPMEQLPSCEWITAQARGNPVPQWMLENCRHTGEGQANNSSDAPQGSSYLDRMTKQENSAPPGYPMEQLPSCAWIIAQARGNPVPQWMLENCSGGME